MTGFDGQALCSASQKGYSAQSLPDDVRAQRVVHLDRYSGKVLADIRYEDFGIAGKITEWGISLHTGRQYGFMNRLLMLIGCLSVILLSITSIIMWWKRRPTGRFAAPARQVFDRRASGALSLALILGLIYPLLGASMLFALAFDYLIPQSWHERFGL